MTFVKDIFGVPLNTDGDTSAIMARLDREMKERHGAEMWGSIYENDSKAFLEAEYIHHNKNIKTGTMEHKVLYGDTVMKDSVMGL